MQFIKPDININFIGVRKNRGEEADRKSVV